MNGNTQITFHFNSSPVTAEGTQTMHIPADSFTRVSDGMGNFEFNVHVLLRGNAATGDDD